ncbi:unnamed protein product [Camellia sinensis]
MAEAVVSFAVERIEDLLIHKANLLYGVRSQVQGMLAELRGMRPFLKDADARQDEHKSISKLVVEIRDVAYNAEDVIETFVFKFEPRGRRGIIHILKRSARIFSEVITLYKIRSQIVTIQRLHANLPSLGLRALMEIGSATSRHLEQTFPQVGDEYFIGIEQDIEVLAAQLVSEEAKQCKVVLIWGMGGVGKTTLARKVYQHTDVRRHFDALAWAFISQQWKLKDVLHNILIQLIPGKKDEIVNMENDRLARKQLDEVQQQKKCLVVLDDVWSSEGFDELSRRNLLNKVESWELFARKAFPRAAAKGDFTDGKPKELPKEIGNLVFLQHLGLKDTGFTKLPPSIGNLKYLQTLDLRTTDEIKGKLRVDGLSNLETLEKFALDKVDVKGLFELTNLRRLGEARIQGKQKNLSEVVNYLLNSKKLQHTSIFMDQCDFCSDEELRLLRQLFSCKCLVGLTIIGIIDKLPLYNSNCYQSLASLTMSGSQLKGDPMATLEKMPNSRILILVDAFAGKNNLVFSANGFRQLEHLGLHSLEIGEWMIEEGAMPTLSFLSIGSCNNLKMLPVGLRFITTLWELDIREMPEAFKDWLRMVNNKGEGLHKFHIPSVRKVLEGALKLSRLCACLHMLVDGSHVDIYIVLLNLIML